MLHMVRTKLYLGDNELTLTTNSGVTAAKHSNSIDTIEDEVYKILGTTKEDAKILLYQTSYEEVRDLQHSVYVVDVSPATKVVDL